MKTIRCMNCMQTMEENTVFCPHCGYEQEEEQSPFSMKPGTILRGRYLVGRVLGQGGFGITYVGYDLTLEIRVAVKEYFPTGAVTRNNTISNLVQWNPTQYDKAQWQAGCDSFLKEARQMAKFSALPGIVRVYDTFPENQTAYIVMEFVEGETLKQKLMREGVMKLPDCIQMLRPLMESLGSMHRQGLIHRDISPDNIMVQPDGSVCLLDFGAAKDVSFQQTAASQQIAKKGFSPPEQYREKGSIGSWTDVYALCATIYYCVTGKLVPDAMDRMYEDTLNFDMRQGESFSRTQIDALRHGLQLRHEERIQTVEELLAGLDDGAKNSPSEMRDENRKRSVRQKIPAENSDRKFRQKTGDKKSLRIIGKMNKKAVGAAAAACLLIPAVIVMLSGSLRNTMSEDAKTAALAGQAENVPATETEEAQIVQSQGTEDEQTMSRSGNEAVISDLPQQEEIPEEPVNVLMKDDSVEWFQLCWQGTVLGSEISRESISSVTFLDTLADMPDGAWDVSWDQDGAVMAWVESCGDASGMLELYIGAEGGVQSKDCGKLFCGYYNVEEIDFNGCFDTSQVEDMSYMFDECANLTKLNLEGIETCSATDMYLMFGGCASLTELDLSGFDTGNVTDMSYMFNYCIHLYKLDVSSFETGQVTDMGSMFASCNNLMELNVSSFDTSQVTDMSYMFAYCSNLAGLDLSGFDKGQVENTEGIFQNCGLTDENTGLNRKKNEDDLP